MLRYMIVPHDFLQIALSTNLSQDTFEVNVTQISNGSIIAQLDITVFGDSVVKAQSRADEVYNLEIPDTHGNFTFSYFIVKGICIIYSAI